MQLIDSHCHIDFSPLSDNIPGLLDAAAENDVHQMLCVSVNMEDFPGVLALAEQNSNIYASVGVHPNSQGGHEPEVEELVAHGQHPAVIAVGETGLDYFRSEGDLSWQHARFHRHIEAARQLQKPLIIHTRDAADDTMETLKTHHAEEPGGIIHCFSEDWRIAKMALDLDFYISFSGIVTFKSARDVQEVAKKVPLERMLVETDAPFLAPVPYRGKLNQPAYVRHVAAFIAQLRGEPLEAIAEQTTANFQRLFNLAS